MLGFREPFAKFFANGWVTIGNTKMSKRAGNVVGPDEFVEQYGADPVRLNILFIGPADQDMEWTEEGVEGMARFVRRLWRIVNEVVAGRRAGEADGGPLARKAHADDREGDRRHRAAVRVQHGDLGRDGADERAVAGHATAPIRASRPRPRSR